MLSALAFGSADGKCRIPPSLAAKYEFWYIGIGLFQACPSPRGICRAFVIFSWNGCKCPTVGADGSYKTPTGGAEKKVNFFSAKFSITVKCWKKGATLTASRRIDKCPTSRSVGRRKCCLAETRSPSQQSHNGRDVAWLQHRRGGRRTNPYNYKQPK